MSLYGADYKEKPMPKPRVSMTKDQFQECRDSYYGYCGTCGASQMGSVEPDAEGYDCEACGEPDLMGYEQALLLGHIRICE